MSDISTRSGMLWEVERILSECKELETMPQILLMENVPQVHGTDNVKDFNKWQLRLEELGYKNYWQDLIATDYGIPQTRNRCFMVSILGNYSYTFPQSIPLKLKLKDMLEDNVDEKYYLSSKQIESLENGNYNASKPSVKLEITDKGLCQTLDTMSGDNRQPLVRVGNKSLQETLEQNNIDDTCYIDTYNKRIDKEKSGTITTGVSFRNNTFLAIKKDTENYIEWEDGKNIQMNCRAWKDDKVVATLNTGGGTKILIKNATQKGYLEATDGDGIDISSRMEHHRGTVQKDKIQTLTTSGGNDRAVVINPNIKNINNENEVFSTLGTNCGSSTSAGGGVVLKNDLRIRKLTPKECFRLMGVKDEDYDKVAKNQSDSSLYHLAGDSLVTLVFCAIMSTMIDNCKSFEQVLEEFYLQISN